MKPARKTAKEKKKSMLDNWKFDPDAKPIGEELLEIADSIPQAELDKLPRDGAENHDYYLYGGKKVSEMNVAGKKNNKAVRISECSEKDIRKGTDYEPAWKKIAERAKKEKRKSALDNWKFDPNAKPYWEKILEISKTIPPEELAKLPSDAAERLDDYLYGEQD